MSSFQNQLGLLYQMVDMAWIVLRNTSFVTKNLSEVYYKEELVSYSGIGRNNSIDYSKTGSYIPSLSL